MKPKYTHKKGFILLNFLLLVTLVLTGIFLYQEHIVQLNNTYQLAQEKHQKAMCFKFSRIKESCR